MPFVGFDENGYEYFDRGRSVLFAASNTHNYLFDYVAKDLSHLPELLEQYVSKKVNMATFEVNDYQYTDNDSAEIKETLLSLHPYYGHEYKKVIINAIGNYLNAMLIYSIYNIKTLGRTDDRNWYIERFNALTTPFLEPDDEAPTSFYNGYSIWIGKPNNDAPEHYAENFIVDIPPKKPLAFANEVITHDEVKKMLFWMLDIAAPNIERLTIPQRMWLYVNIFHKSYSQSDMQVKKHLLLRPARRYRKDHDCSAEVKHADKMHALFAPIYGLSKYNPGREELPTEMILSLNNAIDYAKNITKAEVCEEYEIDNLHQLLYLEILSMIQAGTMIRRCKHCGVYFVVVNRKTAYCDRVDKKGNRCSAVGAKYAFQEKMKTEYPLQIYNRAYKTHHARLKSEKMNQTEFLAWCYEAKEKLNQVRAGELAVSVFEEWLKK